MPQMTLVGSKKAGNQLLYIALQNAGMLFGAGILLVIALYESQLQNAISPGSADH